jgi:hypothetical protein
VPDSFDIAATAHRQARPSGFVLKLACRELGGLLPFTDDVDVSTRSLGVVAKEQWAVFRAWRRLEDRPIAASHHRRRCAPIDGHAVQLPLSGRADGRVEQRRTVSCPFRENAAALERQSRERACGAIVEPDVTDEVTPGLDVYGNSLSVGRESRSTKSASAEWQNLRRRSRRDEHHFLVGEVAECSTRSHSAARRNSDRETARKVGERRRPFETTGNGAGEL